MDCSILILFLLQFYTPGAFGEATNVLVHPQNATKVIGSNIDLDCKFINVNASCVWIRNGSIIKITDRYRYHAFAVNKVNNGNCSIHISNFTQIDATWWQCSCTLNSENINDTCKSNPAYIHVERIAGTELPIENNGTLAMNLTNILLCSVIGLLVAIIIFLVVIYYRCATKAKKKENSDPALPITVANNQSRHNSTFNLQQSTESLCDMCHQYKPDPRTPASVRSSVSPKYDHRDKLMPLPPHDNDLPTYDEVNLHYTDFPVRPNKQMASGQLTDHHTSMEETRREFPMVRPTSMANATCNPLYEPIPISAATESDVDDDTTEVVLLGSQFRDVIYTRIKSKSSNRVH